MAWQRNRAIGGTVILADPNLSWTQMPDGWWQLDDHRVLYVNKQTRMVSVAANCPWQVDLDEQWLRSILEAESEQVDVERALHDKEQGAEKIIVVVLGIMAALILPSFCITPILVQTGLIQVP